MWETRVQSLSWKDLLEKEMATHSSIPGKSRGRRSLVGYRPWGCEESDTTEQLHFHFSLSCIGEGNGNPLQCSCLENPRDGEAWWAAVYGVSSLTEEPIGAPLTNQKTSFVLKIKKERKKSVRLMPSGLWK